MKKRILSLLLVVAMCVWLLPTAALAAEHVHEYNKDTGICSCGAYQPAAYNSSDDVYEISNAGQLLWFAALVNGTTEITVGTETIALDGILAAVTDANGKLTANIDLTGYTWTPIGNYDVDESEGSKYYGTFDGQNYTVLGLYINDSAAGYAAQGLFGYIGATYDNSSPSLTVIDSGTVQNVTVEGSITGGSYVYVGGVAGYNDGTVTGCTNHAKISGSDAVGGVVGRNNGTVTGCTNSAAVEGTNRAGGVVGYNTGTLSESANSGSVSGATVGGIVGSNDSNAVSGCTNSGTVTGTSTTGNASAGGVVGYNYGGSITNCTNEASVSGGQYTGGVVGYQYYGTVSSDTNSGAVSGECYVGGVVGYNYDSEVSDSANSGSVTGTGGSSYAGGVVGWSFQEGSTSTVTSCYNVGTVSGDTSGLLVAWNDGGTVSGCCYLGDASSASIGKDSGGTASDLCYASADQFASGEVAYLLNGGNANNPAWYQNLDNGQTADAYPVPDSTHGTVYFGTNCAQDRVYSNTKLSNAGHLYDDNGFCKYCGVYEPAAYNGTDGVYEIGNAGQLYWFAALVNGDTTITNASGDSVTLEGITASVQDANGVLLNDIDLSVTTSTHTDNSWTPIGDYPTALSYGNYSGTFDGGGYTIFGLYIHNPSSYRQGLFGYVNGGTVKNVTVEGSVTGAYLVGGIVGYLDGGTISGCINHADVTATGNRAGGIAGLSEGTITNCGNTGAISGEDATGYAGGIVGSLNTTDGTASNCYSVGTVSGQPYAGGLAGYLGEDATMTNCYYLDTVAGTAIGVEKGATTSIEEKTADEFASGEVAWLLQKGQPSQTTLVWGQDLTEQTTTTDDDSYPILNRTDDQFTLRVVQLSFYYLVNDTPDSQPFAYGYTNYACALATYPSETGATYTYYTYDGDNYTKMPTSKSFGDDENIYVEATYTVTPTLTNVTSDNSTTSADRGSSYSAILTADAGYTIGSVTVTMGGTDITASAYNSSTGEVSICSVTGAIVITASATDATVSAESVTLNQSTITLAEGSSANLVATVGPENATDQSVTWTSSDASVATVDANGTVTAVSPGTAIITATTTDGGYTASCTVTVSEEKVYELSGKVVEKDGTIIENVNVELQRGGKTIDTAVTDENGYFIFLSEPAGVYNLVATRTTSESVGQTVTILETLEADDNVTITMPQENINATLTVDDFSTGIMAGGLIEEAEAQEGGLGATVTLAMNVEHNPATVEDREKIEQIAEDGTALTYLNITLTLSRNGKSDEKITDTKGVITIAIPYAFTDGKDVVVYRCHDGQAEKLTAASSSKVGADGYYYQDRVNGILYIYATQFSTYAYGEIVSTGTSTYDYDYSEDISYRITTADTTNGTITLSDTRAYEGDRVTITVEPDDGYELESLTVTTSSGKEVKLTEKSDGKYTFTMPSSKVTITATFVKVEEEKEVLGTLIKVDPTTPFTDISNSRFKSAIAEVYAAGLMNGVSETTFDPEGTLTRAMVVTVLYRLAGEPATTSASTFSDVGTGLWYSDAVAWAVENGVVNGYTDGTFKPEQAVTREELATILYRYASSNGHYVGNTFALDGFTDCGDVQDYATTAMEWAVANSVLVSRTTAMLNPSDAATRAEVAQALYILIK